MRRWMAALLMFGFVAALAMPGTASRALAQGKPEPPVEETFLTADGVQLRGLFHKATKDAGTAPVVILLYAPGRDKDKERDMTKGDWEGLANTLAKEGYHVFRFDWRGHGKNGSDIKDPELFWNVNGKNPFTGPWNNRYISGGPPKKPIKNALYLKDLRDARAAAGIAPTYLLDLAAVRAHLDSKNDAGELNTSSIYLIGAETAATIGMAWMATEWHRPAFAPTPNQLGIYPRYEFVPQPLNGGINTEAGADISGAIWLSASHPTSISEGQIKTWVGRFAPKIREVNPMLFLYAEKDNRGKKTSEFFFNEVLVGRGDSKLGLNKLTQTFLKDVKGANDLSGAALLGNNQMLKTEDTIIAFLAAIQKERAKIIRKNRNFTAPWFIKLSAFDFGL